MLVGLFSEWYGAIGDCPLEIGSDLCHEFWSMFRILISIVKKLLQRYRKYVATIVRRGDVEVFADAA